MFVFFEERPVGQPPLGVLLARPGVAEIDVQEVDLVLGKEQVDVRGVERDEKDVPESLFLGKYPGVAQLVARVVWERSAGIRAASRTDAGKPCSAYVCGLFLRRKLAAKSPLTTGMTTDREIFRKRKSNNRV
jgi:hypothetical protein